MQYALANLSVKVSVAVTSKHTLSENISMSVLMTNSKCFTISTSNTLTFYDGTIPFPLSPTFKDAHIPAAF